MMVKMLQNGIYSNISVVKKSVFINNEESEKIDIELLKNKFPDLKTIYFAKEISNGLKKELNKHNLTTGYLDTEKNVLYETADRKIIYYPKVYNSKLEIQKEDCLSLGCIDHSRPFAVTKNRLSASKSVVSFLERLGFENITYGEFSVKIGSTLLELLPHIRKAYVTDFYLQIEALKKRLQYRNKLEKVNTFVLTDTNTLEKVLNKLKKEKVHFNVSFFDADHKTQQKRELRILSEISDYLIVHDVNCEQVEKACNKVLTRFRYEESTSKTGVVTRIYYIKDEKDKIYKKVEVKRK